MTVPPVAATAADPGDDTRLIREWLRTITPIKAALAALAALDRLTIERSEATQVIQDTGVALAAAEARCVRLTQARDEYRQALETIRDLQRTGAYRHPREIARAVLAGRSEATQVIQDTGVALAAAEARCVRLTQTLTELVQAAEATRRWMSERGYRSEFRAWEGTDPPAFVAFDDALDRADAALAAVDERPQTESGGTA